MTEPLISYYKLKQKLLYRKAMPNDDNFKLNTHLPQKQLQHELLAHSSATGRSAFTLTEVKSLAHNGLACTIRHGRILDFTLVIQLYDRRVAVCAFLGLVPVPRNTMGTGLIRS